jgi:cysteine desulfurase
MKKIYLDEAATSKVKPKVIEAVMQYMTDEWYNPSSLYNGGKGWSIIPRHPRPQRR